MQAPFSQMTLAALLLGAIQRHGRRPAITCDGSTFSYDDLDKQSNQLALALRARGIGTGDTVALHLKNSLEFVLADLAILKLGATKCALNELMSANELGYCIGHAGAKLLIRHDSLPLPDFSGSPAPECVTVGHSAAGLPPGTMHWNDLLSLAGGGKAEAGFPAPDPDSRASYSYTGGTTGTPKCVVHSQARMAVNLLAHIVCGDIRADEVMLLTTPLPHSAGYHLQAGLYMGAHIVLDAGFSPRAVTATCREKHVTWTFMVPTMLYRLFDTISDTAQPPRSIRTIVYGAAPMSQERLEQGLDVFGPVFIQLYGQTECPNYITTLGKDDHLDPTRLRSCGRPVPFCNVSIVDDRGAAVQPGEVGEITTASPYLFVEYLNNPEQTEKTLAEGRLHTGDLAYRDDEGFIFLVDRAKDMIITGGLNVYSVEVEYAIRQHDAVRDVAVVGLPHPDWGEAVTAVIVSERDVPHAELKEFLAGSLSTYKLPKEVHRTDALPLTPYGKVDKKKLRQAYGHAGTTLWS